MQVVLSPRITPIADLLHRQPLPNEGFMLREEEGDSIPIRRPQECLAYVPVHTRVVRVVVDARPRTCFLLYLPVSEDFEQHHWSPLTSGIPLTTYIITWVSSSEAWC